MPELTGAELIAAERKRQIEVEGWDAKHDDQWDAEHLAQAAACYGFAERYRVVFDSGDALPAAWKLGPRWWKPTPNDRLKELVKGGALIAAAIDRLLAEERSDAE